MSEVATKPTVKLRRFITSDGEEKRDYPANTNGGGGTVTYEFAVEGILAGLNKEQTRIVLESVVNATRMQMISGDQTPEVIEKVNRKRLPYLGTILALADVDKETLALLTE